MTRSPANLQAPRTLLIQYLDIKPGAPSSDLEPAEVGIVGNAAHRGGYHCGSDRLVTNDYSVYESPRDRAGLTLDAAALDVGWFEWRSPLGVVHNLRTFSVWCVAQCQANSADSRDIREIIYSTDGKTVRRWDRLGKRTTGDSTHLSHTHFSFFRDAIKAGRDQRPLFRRYLVAIGLIPTAPQEHDVNQDEVLKGNTGLVGRTYGQHIMDEQNLRNFEVEPVGAPGLVGVPKEGSPAQLKLAAAQRIPTMAQKIDLLVTKVDLLAGKDVTDESRIAAEVVALLGGPDVDLDVAADALRAAFGDRAPALGALLAGTSG